MKISSITVYQTYGHIALSSENGTASFQLDQAEANELHAAAWEIVQRKQAAMAKEVADARPELLADFSEVAE